MKKRDGRTQDFVWELHPDSYMGAVKTVWSYGKDVGQMKNTPNGWFISYEDENPTSIDQRFFPGLLCNYDSAAEKMNAIMGIAGGLLQTL